MKFPQEVFLSIQIERGENAEKLATCGDENSESIMPRSIFALLMSTFAFITQITLVTQSFCVFFYFILFYFEGRMPKKHEYSKIKTRK
jgi:hypothetical protein